MTLWIHHPRSQYGVFMCGISMSGMTSGCRSLCAVTYLCMFTAAVMAVDIGPEEGSHQARGAMSMLGCHHLQSSSITWEGHWQGLKWRALKAWRV
jgi:hypothetical protein